MLLSSNFIVIMKPYNSTDVFRWFGFYPSPNLFCIFPLNTFLFLIMVKPGLKSGSD